MKTSPKRVKVDKSKSAREFRRKAGKTARANVERGASVQAGPMRGGIRL